MGFRNLWLSRNWLEISQGDLSVFFHPGGGVHGGAYYGFSSGLTGKVKVVGSGYIPTFDDSARIIQILN